MGDYLKQSRLTGQPPARSESHLTGPSSNIRLGSSGRSSKPLGQKLHFARALRYLNLGINIEVTTTKVIKTDRVEAPAWSESPLTDPVSVPLATAKTRRIWHVVATT